MLSGWCRTAAQGGIVITNSKSSLTTENVRSLSLQAVVRIGVAIIVLFVVFLFLFMQRVIRERNEKNHQRYLEQTTKYSYELEQDVEGIKTSMSLLAMNPTINKQVFREDVSDQDMLAVSKELTPIVDSSNFNLLKGVNVYSHFFYTYLPGDGRYFHSRKKLQNVSWQHQVSEDSVLTTFRSSPINQRPQVVFVNTLSPPEGTDADPVYQELVVDLDYFLKERFSYGFENMEIFALHKYSGDVFYSTNPEKNSDIRKAVMQQGSVLVDVQAISEASAMTRGIPITYTLDGLNLVLVFFYPRADMRSALEDISTQVYLISFSVILLLLILFFSYFKGLVSHLNRIIERINAFDERGVAPLLLPSRVTELDNLEYHIVQNQRRIRSLIQKEYLMELENMHAQQQALLTYINPHFLYNTLNSISAMANLEGARTTVEMLLSLSDIFRYTTNTKEVLVTLQRESDMIREFLLLQKMRYQQDFAYTIEIAEEYMDYRLPKFTLQPIVENCFKHGFYGKSGRKEVWIVARVEETTLYLEIKDNGAGVSPEAQEALNAQFSNESISSLPRQDSGGIGLSNVNNRIKLLYGPDYGLSIDRWEQGTCVSVCISIDDSIRNLPNESIYL